MFEIKTFEIRDEGTFIPAVALRYTHPRDPRNQYKVTALWWRAGYGPEGGDGGSYVLLTMLATQQTQHDPFSWKGGRTMKVAHKHIIDRWDDLKDGDVVCVEYILGERQTPKPSEVFQ